MNNSIKITSYIIDILKSNQKVVDYFYSEATGLRIYPIDARTGTTFPFAVINRQSLVPSGYCKDGCVGDVIIVNILIASTTYEESVDIATEIRNALELKGLRNEEINIKPIYLQNVYENIINDTYIQQLDFEIKV